MGPDSANVTLADGATIGVDYQPDSEPPTFGNGSVIREGTIVYNDVIAGEVFQTGHHALIREQTELGDRVLVGTNAVIDGNSTLGDDCSLQTGAYVPTKTTIGNRVFLGPSATLLNDMYPVRSDYNLEGPTLEDDVSVGANTTVLPDVTVGQRSFIAAGAVVTDDVPPETLVIGNPAKHESLPDHLNGGNDP
jgi:acetyltransferase-like isoleucine patch superfamily enzyme